MNNVEVKDPQFDSKSTLIRKLADKLANMFGHKPKLKTDTGLAQIHRLRVAQQIVHCLVCNWGKVKSKFK